MTKISYPVYNIYWVALKRKQSFKEWVYENQDWICAMHSETLITHDCLIFINKYLIEERKYG